MDEKLNYPAEHYRERLSAYAKDTIEYQSTNRFIRYNINKHGNPAVVEEFSDHFKVYVNEQPEFRLWVTTVNRRSSWMGNFYAQVFITPNDLSIKLKASKFQYIFALFIVILFIIGPFCSTGKLQEGSVFFSFFAFALLAIQYSTGKVKCRNFVINFLNKIAE